MGKETQFALKPWIIVLAILGPWIFFFVNMPLHSMVQWWVWPAWFPFSMLIVMAILHGLSKISPKFNLAASDLVLMAVIFHMMAGEFFYLAGMTQWTMFPLWTFNAGYFYHGMVTDPYKAIFKEKIPAFMVPTTETALQNFYYGGAFDFAQWVSPILFWTIWSIAIFIGGFFWSFPLRKQMIDIEKLPFPLAQPTVQTIKWFKEEEGGKPSLFNLKLSQTKMFYGGLVVGMLFYLPNFISSLLPITFPYYLHILPIGDWFMPYTQTVLPGAAFFGYFPPNEILLLVAFVPLDALLTGTLWWIVVGVIYPVVGVKMGILPFTPGNYSVTNTYMTTVGPFKGGIFGMVGVMMGVGLWMIYSYRDHIINILKAGFGLGGSSELPQEEEGVSYRFIVWGGLFCALLLIMLYISGGAAWPIAVIVPIYFIVYQYGWTRLGAETWISSAPNTPYYAPQLFDIGTGLGLWGSRPDPAAFNTMVMYQATGGSGSRVTGFYMAGWFQSYKVSSENKVKARDVLLVSVITMISIAVCVQVLTPWWYTVMGGFTMLGTVQYHVWDMGGYYWQLTYGTPPTMGAPETAAYTISGILFTFACYLMRARFAWFIINPIGIPLVTCWGISHGFPIAITFIIKYVILKAGGVKGMEKYFVPFAMGYALGFGVLYTVSNIIALFTRAIPALLATI